MKALTIRSIIAGRFFGLLFATVVVTAGLLLSGCASAGAKTHGKMRPVSSAQDLANAPADASVAMVCPKCKTVELTELRQEWPNRRDTPKLVAVGSKHSCSSCGGTITVVKGETENQMLHNCSICGTGAAFCCVSAPDASAQ